MATDSQRQALEITGRQIGERQYKVFQLIRNSPAGLTLFELVDRMELPINQISGRVSELAAKGFVINSHKTRLNPDTRKPGTVWIASPRYRGEYGTSFDD